MTANGELTGCLFHSSLPSFLSLLPSLLFSTLLFHRIQMDSRQTALLFFSWLIQPYSCPSLSFPVNCFILLLVVISVSFILNHIMEQQQDLTPNPLYFSGQRVIAFASPREGIIRIHLLLLRFKALLLVKLFPVLISFAFQTQEMMMRYRREQDLKRPKHFFTHWAFSCVRRTGIHALSCFSSGPSLQKKHSLKSKKFHVFRRSSLMDSGYPSLLL